MRYSIRVGIPSRQPHLAGGPWVEWGVGGCASSHERQWICILHAGCARAAPPPVARCWVLRRWRHQSARASEQAGLMDAAAAERAPLLGVVDDVAHAAPSSARRDSRTVAPRWVERRVERPTATARLLGRAGGVLGQSPGKWNIEHKWGEKSSCCTWMDRAETVWDTGRRMLYRTDLFHTVVRSLADTHQAAAVPQGV